MNYTIFLNKLKIYLLKVFFGKRPKISLIIPFSSDNPIRRKNFEWLLKYWSHELPGAEIVIGKTDSKVFCKGHALNDAVRRSSGEVLVILDADAYLPGHIIHKCSDKILRELRHGNNVWYVPYRRLYRLTRRASRYVLNSPPSHPFRIPHPVPERFVVPDTSMTVKYGYRYGAMIMIIPRVAYDILEGFDERFIGWGGEDVSFLRAMNTLFGKYKTLNEDIFHLWHPTIGNNFSNKKWDNQENANSNSALITKYNKANKNPTEMWKLINESSEHQK